MDYSTELRKTYLGAAPHTLVTGLIWLMGGLTGLYYSKGSAILIFIIAGSFNFPLGELVRKVLKAPELISRDNRMPLLFMLSAFTIPLSYPLIYLACKSNVNFFFPAFSILVGAHYLPFYYGYRMPAFFIMSGLMVIQGTACFLMQPDNFSLSAFLSGGILIAFAWINYGRVKNESV